MRNMGPIWAPLHVGMLTQARPMIVKCHEFMKGDIRIRVFIRNETTTKSKVASAVVK